MSRPLALALLVGTILVGAAAAAQDWQLSTLQGAKPGSVLIGAFAERIFAAPSATSARRGTGEPKALLPWFSAQAGPGCIGPWLLIGPQAWICSSAVSQSTLPSVAAESVHERSSDGLPFHYFKVGQTGARAYATLANVADGKVARELETDFIVAISRSARFQDQDFGLSSKGTWIAIEDLLPMHPSTFQGSELSGDLTQIAWTRRDSTPLFNRPGQKRIGSLRRRTQLNIVEEVAYQSGQWLRTGENQWLRRDDVQRPTAGTTPPGLLPLERWIDIDLSAQVLTAYQGIRPVFTTLVSSGRGAEGSELSTPKGEHRIWVKLRTTDMSNLENEEAQRYYAIEDVPWVMYFQGGYGLHGAFWHDSFGTVRSHGCVNLAPRDAERLFYWVSPRLPAGWSAVLPTDHDLGTRVVVR